MVSLLCLIVIRLHQEMHEKSSGLLSAVETGGGSSLLGVSDSSSGTATSLTHR